MTLLFFATAPYAKSQREGFQNYTMPTISGRASAGGLGRSTIPVSQARLGSQEVESDIANRVAQLTLANERQKAAEKGTAIGQYGNLMSSDYNSILNQITGQNNAAVSAADVQNYNNEQSNATKQQGYNALMGVAEGGLSGSYGNLSSILNPTTTSSGGVSLQGMTSAELQDAFNLARKNRAAVNIS